MVEIIIQDGSLATPGDDTSCVTWEDVRDFKVDCQLVEICCDNATIQDRLDRMTELVNSITGVDWCPEEDCFEFSGTGKGKLFFTPTTSKYLNEIESIDIIKCGASCGQSTEEEVDLTLIKNHHHWIEYDCSKRFPCGRNNIRICGTWGKTMPEGIKQAIIMLAIESLQPGTLGLTNPGGVSRASWEDFSISYRDEGGARIPTTGYKEIDLILDPFISTTSQVKMFVQTNDSCVPKSCGKVTGCG